MHEGYFNLVNDVFVKLKVYQSLTLPQFNP